MREGLCRAAGAASLIGLAAWGCSGALAPQPALTPESEEPEEPVLLGRLSREEIEAAVPDWVTATVEAVPDAEAALALAAAGRGAEVEIYLGTWCSDSRRELGRFWRALDDVGGFVPFHVEYIGVDREKVEPRDLIGGVEIGWVPTFVVSADGRELGRVVEESPNGIEVDLLALLRRDVTGLLSATVDTESDREP